MSIYTDILIEARKKIESGSEKYVCYAIGYGSKNIARNCLIHWISKLLGNNGTYENWIINNSFDSYLNMTQEDFRAGRLQWLDWMIENVDREISK